MPRHKNIAKNSLLLHELAYIPEWQKHHPMQEDPLEGVPSGKEFFSVFENRRGDIDKIYEDLVNKVFVVKLVTGVWYTTPVEELEKLRKRLRKGE